MTTKKYVILVLIVLLGGGLYAGDKPAQDQSTLSDQLTMSVLYVQSAAEYRALCYQAFNAATTELENRLQNERPKKPFAVIVDIDETMLDNSPYEAKLITDTLTYPDHWKEWIDLAEADPIPGAVPFLNDAIKKGVEVFYVSNRKNMYLQATMKNLRAKEFPHVDTDHVYLRTDMSSKTPRRNEISKNYTIALLIGDNLNDFSDIFEKKPSSDRKQMVDANQGMFGSKYIILPNPMYGEWEGAVYDYNWSMTPAQRDSARKANLRTY